jgi:hypothetical protein
MPRPRPQLPAAKGATAGSNENRIGRISKTRVKRALFHLVAKYQMNDADRDAADSIARAGGVPA